MINLRNFKPPSLKAKQGSQQPKQANDVPPNQDAANEQVSPPAPPPKLPPPPKRINKVVPVPFAEIAAPMDDETDILQKRALMKYESTRTYNQLVSSVKAHEAARASMLWMQRLLDNVKDENERTEIQQAIYKLTESVERLFGIREKKVKLASQMEVALTKARKNIRDLRTKVAQDELARREQSEEPVNKFDPEGAHPDTVGEDPVSLPAGLVIGPSQQQEMANDILKQRAKMARKPQSDSENPDDL